MGVLGVRSEGMEDSGHDHTDLITANDDEDDSEVLPGDTAGYGRWPPVPQQQWQEEEETQQVGPDVESFIVKW